MLKLFERRMAGLHRGFRVRKQQNGVVGQHRGAIGEHRGVDGEHRGADGKHRDVDGEHRGVDGEHHDVVGEHRDVVRLHRRHDGFRRLHEAFHSPSAVGRHGSNGAMLRLQSLILPSPRAFSLPCWIPRLSQKRISAVT